MDAFLPTPNFLERVLMRIKQTEILATALPMWCYSSNTLLES